MNELKVFSSTDFGELGVMLIDGKEWFPATQCARILGYSDPFKAIKLHCNSEGWVNCPVLTNGGTQQVKYINEGNLYRLIVSSKLPQAEKFERWVFDEVLPSIRHSGGYVGNVEELIAKTAAAVVSEVMKQLLPSMCSVNPVDEAFEAEEIEITQSEKYKSKKQSPTIDALDDDLKNQVVKMINPNSKEDMELLREVLRNNHFDNEDE